MRFHHGWIVVGEVAFGSQMTKDLSQPQSQSRRHSKTQEDSGPSPQTQTSVRSSWSQNSKDLNFPARMQQNPHTGEEILGVATGDNNLHIALKTFLV